jgi:hypothetical protein
MKLDRQTLNISGFITVGIMAVMFGLAYSRLVPETLTIPFFVVALLLLIVRVVMRVIVARRERTESTHL